MAICNLYNFSLTKNFRVHCGITDQICSMCIDQTQNPKFCLTNLILLKRLMHLGLKLKPDLTMRTK